MCGIAGLLHLGAHVSVDEGQSQVRKMADAIRHRGPDDSGVWSDATKGVFLAHRRLSIVDLSAAGHQPMVSASGRYVCVYNGEVYNHRAIRSLLNATSSPAWRGHSDTEVLLTAIEQWGLEAALKQLVGMFSIALWDRSRSELTLVRDRAGEKPLYWGRVDGTIAFASELTAIEAAFGDRLSVSASSLPLLLRFGYIPSPHTIYSDIEKLAPGTWARICVPSAHVERGEYWSARESLSLGSQSPLALTDEQAVDQLQELLLTSVKDQLEADVQVGAFLSGGVDSSTVVAVAQSCSPTPVHTFSIGFDDVAFDESIHARRVAEHLGTRHRELHVTAQDALKVVPKLSSIYDEPFADSSQIPTYLVSEMARSEVTVALTGDGGDELFSGYPRYDRAAKIVAANRHVPARIRKSLGGLLGGIKPERWDSLVPGFMDPGTVVHGRKIGDRVHRFADLLQLEEAAVYRYFASSMPSIDMVLPGVIEPLTHYDSPSTWPDVKDKSRLYMWMDFMTYLPDDLLVKTDRASMAVSLETRVPLLDHRIVEFSHQLPRAMLCRDGSRKWLLKKLLYRHVPQHIVDRPKMGFSMPLVSWLRGPLLKWAEALLFDASASGSEFSTEGIRGVWREHQSGARDWSQVIWTVLMYQDWKSHRQSVR